MTAVVRAWRGVRWYLREVTGEGRWDAYVASCDARGVPPGSRRDFERARDRLREQRTSSRCC